MNLKVKNFNVSDYLPKFQEGGQMPDQAPVEQAPAAAPAEAPAEGGDPTQQIMEAAMQALQNQDCNLAMQVLQAIVQMLGGAAQEQAPAEPVYRAGGKLIRRINK